MSKKVEIEWTSKDEAVARTLQKTERGMDAIARKLDKIEQASKKTTQVTETGFEKATQKITGMATALIGGGSLLTAVDMVRRANEEMIRQADEAAKKYDDLFRKFRVQAGLSELGAEQAKASILKIAEQNAVREDVATAGAMGLVGAGFSTADATGGALNVLLRARAATNATGGSADDLEGIATSVSAYLTSQGITKTPENLKQVLQGGFALRQTGAFELSDLTELGKHGAAMRGLLSQEEQFAAFGTLVDQMPSAEAATSLRNIVSRLSTARVGRTSKQALEQIGLTAEDVDLVGENFGQVLGLLGQRLQALPEEQRAGVLKQLFEEAGVAPARALINERTGRYQDYQRSLRTAGGVYAETVDVAQSGVNAATIRQEVRKNQRAEERYRGEGLFGQALDEQFAEAGVPNAVRTVASGLYQAGLSVGLTPEQAAYIPYQSPTSPWAWYAGGDITGRAREQVRSDQQIPMKVEVVNQPGAAPSIQGNAVRGFGR